jgi:hypothetical protein
MGTVRWEREEELRESRSKRQADLRLEEKELVIAETEARHTGKSSSVKWNLCARRLSCWPEKTSRGMHAGASYSRAFGTGVTETTTLTMWRTRLPTPNSLSRLTAGR